MPTQVQWTLTSLIERAVDYLRTKNVDVVNGGSGATPAIDTVEEVIESLVLLSAAGDTLIPPAMRVSGDYVQWQDKDSNWNNLFSLITLKGVTGDSGPKGDKGDKGNQIVLNVGGPSGAVLQYQYAEPNGTPISGSWIDIVDLAVLIGSGTGTGSGSSGTYTNTGTVITVGGIPAGTSFTDTPIETVLDQLFSPYQSPVVSVAVTPSIVSIESVPVSGTATVSVTKKTNPLLPTVTVTGLGINTTGTVAAGGGSAGSFPFSGVVASGTVTASVNDGKQFTNGTGLLSVYYPAMYGVYASAPADSDSIKTNATRIVSAKQSPYTIPLNGTGYAVFAYPAEYGNLASILDPNSFNVTAGWTKQTMTFTFGTYTKSYFVYAMQTPSSYTGSNYRFNF